MKRVGGLFLYAILAGFCIGLGGTVFLKLKDAFPGGNVVGALLFTIGLFTVCTRGYALFTGKACYLFDNPLPAYLLDLLVFWVGNLLGAMLIAGLEHLTGMVGGETGIDATAAALVEGKMGPPIWACLCWASCATSAFSSLSTAMPTTPTRWEST